MHSQRRKAGSRVGDQTLHRQMPSPALPLQPGQAGELGAYLKNHDVETSLHTMLNELAEAKPNNPREVSALPLGRRSARKALTKHFRLTSHVFCHITTSSPRSSCRSGSQPKQAAVWLAEVSLTLLQEHRRCLHRSLPLSYQEAQALSLVSIKRPSSASKGRDVPV